MNVHIITYDDLSFTHLLLIKIFVLPYAFERLPTYFINAYKLQLYKVWHFGSVASPKKWPFAYACWILISILKKDQYKHFGHSS